MMLSGVKVNPLRSRNQINYREQEKIRLEREFFRLKI